MCHAPSYLLKIKIIMVYILNNASLHVSLNEYSIEATLALFLWGPQTRKK